MLCVAASLVTTSAVFAQEAQRVTGVVRDEKGEPLMGAQIIPVGATHAGTVADLDGKYTVNVPKGVKQITISYMGFASQTIDISGRKVIDVVLKEDSKVIETVVVTALGIKRSEKALSYNVQQVKGSDVLISKDANFINSLSGKVAGVNINASSSGVGGASKVVMRGTRSIEQSSNVLYVVDGVPMYNQSGEGGEGFDSRGASESVADINPEDIESMSVLTGAAAAALYGTKAANGAIVITTKKGKAGRLEVTVSQNTDFLNPFVLPRFQNRYGTGSSLSEVPEVSKSWGRLLGNVPFTPYDPARDYFRTGVITTETVSLSAGTDKNQTYFSASAVNSKGIVPNNKYNRYNFTFRNTTSMLDDRLTLDVGLSYVLQSDYNMINQGTYANPLVSAYLLPRGADWQDVKMYERYDMGRGIYVQHWPYGIDEFTGQNPYWINYRNLSENNKKRYMLNAGLSYKVADWLTASSRVRVDNSNTVYERKLYSTTEPTISEGSKNGFYRNERTDDKQFYADVLLNANKRFVDGKLSLQANIGASITDIRQDALGNSGPLRDDLIPNVFNVFQLDDSRMKRYQSGYVEQTQSVFGSAEIGWDGTYYLTVTGRNDWPSMLAGPKSSQSSFFYPSIGASVVLSEAFKLPEVIDYLKLRTSYASVGLPFPRHYANPTYEWDYDTKQWKTQTVFPMYNLKSERTDSWEAGITAKFAKHFNLDVALYHTRTYNQTFNPSISVSSGYSKMYIQTGSVTNKGIELSLSYDNQWGKFGWSTSYTFSANRNHIDELVRNYVHPETGDVINKNRLDVGGLSQARFILKEGGTLGDLYSLSDVQRDDNGRVYLNPEGKPATDNNVGDIYLGSVFPKSNMALRNSFSYGDLRLDLLVSARFGGIVYSATQAALDLYGVSEASAAARDAGTIVLNGGDHVSPELWYSTISAKSGIPQYYTYSATNIRLQEAALSYTIRKQRFFGIGDLTLSVFGRNLLMLYCKAPFDPESTASTGNYYQGIDNFMMPSTRNVGFNVKLRF
ncbi:MAG: SusC/RagA family TonB-linked outer membrane protein [Porphyromonas sp.]|nr:SusC/RagA family TonB-linked outer membrane protein [Porphyromonas sp.]